MPHPESLTVETPPVVLNDECETNDAIAEAAIATVIKLAKGERLDACRTGPRTFRCNIWATAPVQGSVIRDNRIVRSYFATFDPAGDVTVK